MANRNTLHIRHLPKLREWLQRQGFAIQAPKGTYEVLRANRGKETVIIFKRSEAKEHLTYQDKDCRIISRFLLDN